MTPAELNELPAYMKHEGHMSTRVKGTYQEQLLFKVFQGATKQEKLSIGFQSPVCV